MHKNAIGHFRTLVNTTNNFLTRVSNVRLGLQGNECVCLSHEAAYHWVKAWKKNTSTQRNVYRVRVTAIRMCIPAPRNKRIVQNNIRTGRHRFYVSYRMSQITRRKQTNTPNLHAHLHQLATLLHVYSYTHVRPPQISWYATSIEVTIFFHVPGKSAFKKAGLWSAIFLPHD